MIYITNKRRKIEKIKEEFPGAIILDITSKSEINSGRILSPFFPHKNIPIPFTKELKATCVEAVWQGLKVFQDFDVDFPTFKNDTMKDIKRTVRKYGKTLGHRKGACGKELLSYFDARMLIYLPTYKWVLENVAEVNHVINRIREQSKRQDIVLLDYNTNVDFRDMTKPMSHAGLVKLYIEDKYPSEFKKYEPMTEEELKQKEQRDKKEKKNRRKEINKQKEIW